ncbi:MAG: winged helix-turn-helix domain-containing protein [Wenzhouxiangella sp.]
METSANIRQELGTGDDQVQAFGEFVLDRGRKTLLRNGEPIALKPKVYDLLCLLIDHRDCVLANAEIMDALWPRQDIDESNLGKLVYELRQALGDAALIQNLPRRGYRFAGQIIVPLLDRTGPEAPDQDLPVSRAAPRAAMHRLAVPVALIVIAVVILVTWLGPLNDRSTPVAAPVFSFSPTRIAVLPFQDFSPTGDQQFLGDGLADTLLRTFAGVEELSVIARASAFAYRGRDIATVARDLEVGSVLEGSVQRSGDQLRIAVQLVRTADQRQIWSQSFDLDAGDIFATQDEIASQVLQALLGSEMLGVARRSFARITPEVHDLYVQGRELWQQREAASTRRAVELLTRAVELNPDFIEARAELATALYFSPDLTRLQRIETIEPQLEAVFAVVLDEPQALAIRGLLLLDEGRVGEGRAALRRALAERPNDVNFLGWLAGSYEASGLMGTAARYSRRAFELDPMNLFARTRLLNMLLAEQSAEAMVLARQNVRLFPEAPVAWGLLVSVLRSSGDDVAAVLAAVDALDYVADPSFFIFQIAYVFNVLGDFELADRWRALIPDYRPPVQQEFFWITARDDRQGALDYIDDMLNQHGRMPLLLAWYARALIGIEAYEEAREVLTGLMDEVPDWSDPENLNWAQVEIPILLAAMHQRLGDIERAQALDSKVQSILAFVRADWPTGAIDQDFFLDYALERFEQAVAREMSYSWRPRELLLLVRHVPMWFDYASVPAGRAHIAELERQEAQDLARLRALDIPWLLHPELWPGAQDGSPL